MAILKVYVPRPGTYAHNIIRKGSGVVGRPADEGRVLIHYEGNTTGAANIRNFADKVMFAAGRLEQDSPTTSKMWPEATDLVEVGEWDGERVTVTDAAALAEWLGARPTPADLVPSRPW